MHGNEVDGLALTATSLLEYFTVNLSILNRIPMYFASPLRAKEVYTDFLSLDLFTSRTPHDG